MEKGKPEKSFIKKKKRIQSYIAEIIVGVFLLITLFAILLILLH